MSSVVVIEHLTLDGVMQAAGRPDEDLRGGFEHGGWARRLDNPMITSAMGARMGASWSLLLGRRTYEDFAAFWPSQPEPNPFTEALNNVQKYVASTTLQEPLAWINSALLTGDAVEAVVRLKERQENNLVVFGSGELVRSLLRRGLVDELVLVIHPLILGTGRRLFGEGSPTTPLRLVDSRTTPGGVIIATYEAAVPAAPAQR